MTKCKILSPLKKVRLMDNDFFTAQSKKAEDRVKTPHKDQETSFPVRLVRRKANQRAKVAAP